MAADVVTVARLEAWIHVFADLIAEHRAYLTELDSAIGDADHGINMDRGMQAVCAKLDAPPIGAADELFRLVGMTLVSSIGGASGPLYGTFFLRFGTACGPSVALSADDVVKAFRAGVEGLVARGRPELGDKTMFDSMHPALEALDAAVGVGMSPGEAFNTASRETLLHRFFTPLRELSPDQVRRLLVIDPLREACVVGELVTEAGKRIVCGARYVRMTDPLIAEIALTVHDDFQAQGIGGFVLRHLIRLGQTEGIRTFAADVLPTNLKMLRLLEKVAPRRRSKLVEGVCHVEFDLADATLRTDGSSSG